MADKEKISELFKSFPLYKKLEVESPFLTNPIDIDDLTFMFFCPNEKSEQTFKIQLEPEFINRYGSQLKDELNAYIDNERKHIFVFNYSGTCQYCNKIFRYPCRLKEHLQSKKCKNSLSTVSNSVPTVSDSVLTVSDSVPTVFDNVPTVSDSVKTKNNSVLTVKKNWLVSEFWTFLEFPAFWAFSAFQM